MKEKLAEVVKLVTDESTMRYDHKVSKSWCETIFEGLMSRQCDGISTMVQTISDCMQVGSVVSCMFASADEEGPTATIFVSRYDDGDILMKVYYRTHRPPKRKKKVK
jgi:hypothetical protein